jgi:hypothetical protein
LHFCRRSKLADRPELIREVCFNHKNHCKEFQIEHVACLSNISGSLLKPTSLPLPPISTRILLIFLLVPNHYLLIPRLILPLISLVAILIRPTIFSSHLQHKPFTFLRESPHRTVLYLAEEHEHLVLVAVDSPHYRHEANCEDDEGADREDEDDQGDLIFMCGAVLQLIDVEVEGSQKGCEEVVVNILHDEEDVI